MSLGGGFNQAVNEAVNAAIDDVSRYVTVYVMPYMDVISVNNNDCRAFTLLSLLEIATMTPALSPLQALRGKYATICNTMYDININFYSTCNKYCLLVN